MHIEKHNYTKKNILIKIFDFYVFSNLHVALSAFLLVKITLLNIGISTNTTSWLVFFSTLLSYNIIRFLRLSSIDNWYNKWIENNKNLLYMLSVISFIAIIYLVFQFRLKALFVLFPFAIATIFYVFPLEKYSLRNIAGLKLFLIAFSWAGITVLFPLTQNYINPRIVDYITFLQRFLFIVVITIPFDIRDLEYDNDKLKTLPQQFKIKKTKNFAYLLLISFFILELFKPILEQHILSTLVITLISGVLLKYSSDKQSKYYSAFFVEALPIVWFLLVFFNL